jgi:hypothetical protein
MPSPVVPSEPSMKTFFFTLPRTVPVDVDRNPARRKIGGIICRETFP